jgi:putative membrane protein
MIVQVIVYFVVRCPQSVEKDCRGELAPAIWLGAASLAAGALNAASMTY